MKSIQVVVLSMFFVASCGAGPNGSLADDGLATGEKLSNGSGVCPEDVGYESLNLAPGQAAAFTLDWSACLKPSGAWSEIDSLELIVRQGIEGHRNAEVVPYRSDATCGPADAYCWYMLDEAGEPITGYGVGPWNGPSDFWVYFYGLFGTPTTIVIERAPATKSSGAALRDEPFFFYAQVSYGKA